QGDHSDPAIDTLELGPGERIGLYQTPPLRPAALGLENRTPSSLRVRAEADGQAFYEKTIPCALRARNEAVWGPRRRFARYLTAWATPHDAAVQAVRGQAGPRARQEHAANGRRGLTLGAYNLLGHSTAEIADNVGRIARLLYQLLHDAGL